MKEYILKFIAWIGKMFSSSGEVSSKRFNAVAVVIAAIIWLSADLHHRGITENWKICYQSLLVAAVVGYVGGVAVGEKKKKEEPVVPPPEDKPVDVEGEPK